MIKLSTIRPGLYIVVLLLSVPVGYVGYLRTQGVFACTADGYFETTGAYLGYCNAAGFGDYDHGAFWFGLEPAAVRFAANADVLFLGSSRVEFALSTVATDHWFSSAGLKHYLLGFANVENSTFVAPLLVRLKPRAKVYIINVDRFFTGVETDIGSEILHDPDVEQHFRQKKLWQHLQRSACTRVRAICGHEVAYFRASEHGHWVAKGSNNNPSAAVADGPIQDRDHWVQYAALAEQFISSLPVDHACVLLTVVPSSATRADEAKAIASAVGIELVTPQLDGLRTFGLVTCCDRFSARPEVGSYGQRSNGASGKAVRTVTVPSRVCRDDSARQCAQSGCKN
jgi:hypothetical protein